MKLWPDKKKYVETILKRFNIHDSKPMKTLIDLGTKLFVEQCRKIKEVKEISHVPYANVVGILMYAMVCTRLDITHAVGVLSRYMSKPRKEHCTAMKRVLRYLHGKTNFSIYYKGKRKEKSLNIKDFVDGDWARDLENRRSTNGYVFNLFGGAISWMSKRQAIISLSTT